MSKTKLYLTALAAALIAANGVLHLVNGGVVAAVVTMLSSVGLVLLPSPLAGDPKE